MVFFNWLVSVCLVLFLVLFQASRKLTRTDKLPPGPPAIPIFGNLFLLGDKPHKSLANLAKIHGDIMTLKLGQTTTIVLSSETMAKEILQTQDAISCNRTVPDALRALQHHEAGLPWMPVSTTWKNLRKICNLHIFASKKLDANQHLRRSKVEQLLTDVRDSSRLGEAIEISTAVFKTSLNLLSNTVFSIDFADSSSHTALEFRETMEAFKEEFGKPNFSDFFPTLLAKLDLQGIRRRVTILFEKIMKLFDKEIEKRLELRKMNDYIPTNDFLDILLQISQDDNEELDRNLIKHLIFDLFTAGTDTTTSTLEWAMAELLCNPKSLLEARRELQQIIGKGNVVEESDVTRLPYLQAILKETLRLHPPAPFLLPRKVEADIEIHNFVVPKDAQVLINAWAIGRDPSIWEEADLFHPERFIGSDIDVKGRNFGLIPFGAGRRICPGSPLAMRMLHLILGRLIHSFVWELEDGITPESLNMDDKYGIVLQKAQPLKIIAHSV
ncbi:geraniol 8-hydroxylase-like [Gossypium arboreum]|nr:geraniol 8-hydroxylase-like [Gossypium arboreum]